MKRFFAPIAAVLAAALLLASCGSKLSAPKKDVTEELTRPFESTVSIKYKDIDATAKIAKQAPGYCKITFASPESLQDMAVEFTLEKVNISYKKLNASFSPGSLPGSAVSKMIVSAIDAATKKDGVRVEYKDGVLLLTGQMESGEFTLTLDPENGNLMRLSVPGDNFEAEFANFSFIEQ